MKNKYQKDFELVSSVQNKKVIGRKGYVTVRVIIDEEKEYCVMVYPDGDEDTDTVYDAKLPVIGEIEEEPSTEVVTDELQDENESLSVPPTPVIPVEEVKEVQAPAKWD